MASFKLLVVMFSQFIENIFFAGWLVISIKTKGFNYPRLEMYAYVCICVHMYAYVCICMHMYAYVCMKMGDAAMISNGNLMILNGNLDGENHDKP